MRPAVPTRSSLPAPVGRPPPAALRSPRGLRRSAGGSRRRALAAVFVASESCSSLGSSHGRCVEGCPPCLASIRVRRPALGNPRARVRGRYPRVRATYRSGVQPRQLRIGPSGTVKRTLAAGSLRRVSMGAPIGCFYTAVGLLAFESGRHDLTCSTFEAGLLHPWVGTCPRTVRPMSADGLLYV